MYIKNIIGGYLLAVAMVLVSTPAVADVVMIPAENTWMYGWAYSYQGLTTGNFYGEYVFSEDMWVYSASLLDDPIVSVEDDPLGSNVDEEGLSSFASTKVSLTDIGGWSSPDNTDTFQLFVNNQATQDPGDDCTDIYGPYGGGIRLHF
jgi:hypothetical protein